MKKKSSDEPEEVKKKNDDVSAFEPPVKQKKKASAPAITQLMENVTADFKFDSRHARITCLVACEPGKRLFVCAGGTVVTLDTETPKLNMKNAFRVASNDLAMRRVSPSVDGTYMAGVTANRKACWWRIEDGRGVMFDVPPGSSNTHMCANAEYLAIATIIPHQIMIWTPANGQLFKTLKVSDNVCDMIFDQQHMLTVVTSATRSIYDLQSAENRLVKQTKNSYRASTAHIDGTNNVITYSDYEMVVVEPLGSGSEPWSHTFVDGKIVDAISSTALLAMFTEDKVMKIYNKRDTRGPIQFIAPAEKLYAIFSRTSIAYVELSSGNLKVYELPREERSSVALVVNDEEEVTVPSNRRRRDDVLDDDALV